MQHRYETSVNPKVTAATGGAGVGSATGIIAVYVAEKLTGNMPLEVELAVVVLATALAAFAGGWLKRVRTAQSENRSPIPPPLPRTPGRR